MKSGETVNDSVFELRTDDKRTLRDTTYFFLVSYLPVVPRLCGGKQRRKSSISVQDHAEQNDSSSVLLHTNVSTEENINVALSTETGFIQVAAISFGWQEIDKSNITDEGANTR